VELPPDLRQALEAEAMPVPLGRLAARAGRLSAGYRRGEGTGAADAEAAGAYAAHRMPATFAAVRAALAQVAETRPGFAPHSLFDAGAGTGAAAWAAADLWPSLARTQMLERSRAMAALGRRLQAAADHPALRTATWQRADLAGDWATPPADLAVIAYALGEVPADGRERLLERLWQVATDTLVVVEPGTPAGFAVVRNARSHLLGRGGHLLAPCPHARGCPMAEGDWCHFAARLSRTSLERRVKGAALGHEDEKFAFVAVGRLPAGRPASGRVLRHPQTRPGHVRLRLCTPAGLADVTVARSDKERYRVARHLDWGSSVPWGDDATP